MGLYVGVCGSEKLLDAVDGKVFGFVDNLTSAIIAASGITFGVFVCQTRAHGGHDLVADKVFGSDKLYAFFLAEVFTFDDVKN